MTEREKVRLIKGRLNDGVCPPTSIRVLPPSHPIRRGSLARANAESSRWISEILIRSSNLRYPSFHRRDVRLRGTPSFRKCSPVSIFSRRRKRAADNYVYKSDR